MSAPSIVPAPAPEPTRPLTAGSAAGMTEKAIIADAANAAICAPRAIARRPRALPNMHISPARVAGWGYPTDHWATNSVVIAQHTLIPDLASTFHKCRQGL